jgi:predicted ATPase with chaperone activity
MSLVDVRDPQDDLLATIFSDESYIPAEPSSIADLGLPVSLIESLVCKRLLVCGMTTGRKLAEQLCVPFRVLESVYQTLRSRQVIVHTNSAPFNDYTYTLTEHGRERAAAAMKACAYSGPAPVPLMDYVLSVEAQSIRAEAPKQDQLKEAFRDITINEHLFDSLGPAINSGAGLFLYGEPGNGKSTLARRITMCFGQRIWIPHALYEDGQLIKLFDAAYHETDPAPENSIVKQAVFDPRWVKIRRPTVVVGGELTLDNLEMQHNAASNVSEAPLQMKSNSGCLLIDDFGRQRVDPVELLNRWIIPLENRVDFLTLATGKKIQVPFEQLIIFSTNLDPDQLVDEAFLRRIPYKIEITDPDAAEFHELFRMVAGSFKCEYRRQVVDYLLHTHYHPFGRRLRRCHPRDLMSQIRNYCVYNELKIEMKEEYFDRVVRTYFTTVLNESARRQFGHPSPTGKPADVHSTLPTCVIPPSETD